jgi:hypothetical protein
LTTDEESSKQDMRNKKDPQKVNSHTTKDLMEGDETSISELKER